MPEPAIDAAVQAELVTLMQRHAAADGTHATAIPALHLLRASAPAQLLPAIYEPGLVLVVQGRKQAVLGQALLTYDPLHCLVVSVTMLPLAQIIEASPDHPYLCVRLGVAPGELATLLRDVPAAAEDARPACGLNLARVSRPLLDAVLRLLRLLDEPAADSHAQRIGRAIDLLKQRFAEPVRVEEVAHAARMSASSLHAHFRAVTSMSPLQYQKMLRLHHARQLMLSDGIDAATAGHRVGYESPSQFSREYRRQFGTPPKADAAQARLTVTPPAPQAGLSTVARIPRPSASVLRP